MLTKKQALGARIKELRNCNKITQDKLSELVGIDPKHLSRIENGKNYPSLETLEKLSKNLNVTLEDLFRINHLNDKAELINEIHLHLEKLPDKKLRFIYKMIKELY